MKIKTFIRPKVTMAYLFALYGFAFLCPSINAQTEKVTIRVHVQNSITGKTVSKLYGDKLKIRLMYKANDHSDSNTIIKDTIAAYNKKEEAWTTKIEYQEQNEDVFIDIISFNRSLNDSVILKRGIVVDKKVVKITLQTYILSVMAHPSDFRVLRIPNSFKSRQKLMIQSIEPYNNIMNRQMQQFTPQVNTISSISNKGKLSKKGVVKILIWDLKTWDICIIPITEMADSKVWKKSVNPNSFSKAQNYEKIYTGPGSDPFKNIRLMLVH